MTGIPASFAADLPAWSFAFMLVLARFGAAMALLPGLGEAVAPAMVRVGLALAVTILLLPVVFPHPPATPEASLTAAGMVAAEVATGLWLGWLARLLCLALSMAAQFIAYLLGLATVLQPDPELGAQSTALSALFELAAPLVILVTGLYTLPLTALAGSFRLIPPGTLLPDADSTATAVAAVGQSFALALRLASPFVLAAIVWHVAIGLIARLVPRLQIYFVSMPGQIVGGLILLASVFGVILATWQDAVRDGFLALPGN
jgi:flagellar biosynthesis protein FliR